MKASFAGNDDQVPHEACANPPALIPVDHRECDLGFSWLHTDIAPRTDDDLLSRFLRDRDQGDVFIEIDIQTRTHAPFPKIRA